LLVGIAAAACGCMAVAVAIRVGWILLARVSSTATVMFAMGVALSAWGYAITGSGGFTMIIALLMFTAGVLHLYRGWMIANLALALAVWLPVGLVSHGRAFATHALALGFVTCLSVMVHEVTMRYFARLEELRVRELAHERERQTLREQLWHSQKLESLGALAGGVAHDMNNILAAVVGLGELVRARVEPPVLDDVDQLLDAAHRGADLTRNLLAFGRRGAFRTVVLDARTLIEGVANLVKATMPKQITLAVHHHDNVNIHGDSSQLTHAMLNLCLNAIGAMGGKGHLEIRTSQVEVSNSDAARLGLVEGTYLRCQVIDDGEGIAPDILPRIFEPFFTTKPSGTGTGLGLAMVYGTIQNHRGAVAVESSVGKGTAVTIYVPASRSAPEPAKVSSCSNRGRGRLLVIDDEPIVRDVTRRCMERAGYEVVVAEDGQVGIDRYQACERQQRFDLVLLDMGMPVMDGRECFERLRALDPAVKVVIVSGFADEDDARRCLEQGAMGFVDKPYASRQLIQLVGEILHPTPAG
jgi:signal transduction histidine kinase/CheY-like chemotaxis protein